MRYPLFIVLIFTLSLALFACDKEPRVVVNGEKITDKEIALYLKEKTREHSASGIQITSEAIRHSTIQQMISEKLLAQGAKEKGMTVSEEELKQRIEKEKKNFGEVNFKKALKEVSLSGKEYEEIIRERILFEKFVMFLVPDHAVTEEDVTEYYKKSPTPFLMPEKVLVRFISAASEEKANAALMKLKYTRFNELADSLKGTEGYSVSDDYAWVAPESFSQNIAQALRKAQKDEVGGPFEGRQDYYIFHIRDKSEERIKSLEEARGEIRAIIMNQKRSNAVIHWLAEKEKNSTIVIN